MNPSGARRLFAERSDGTCEGACQRMCWGSLIEWEWRKKLFPRSALTPFWKKMEEFTLHGSEEE